MNNLAASIIGLHDPVAHTIQFNANFIGKMNVSFAMKHNTVNNWAVRLTIYAASGSTHWDLSGGLEDDFCSIDGNGLFTYDPEEFEKDTYSGTAIKPFYTNIAIHCQAYNPDLDSYESLTFNFRYGQIS